MAVELLRYKGVYKDERPSLLKVEPEEFDEFCQGERIQYPAAYILSDDELDQLIDMSDDVIVDQGAKNSRIELSRYFLKQQGPVALRGSYRSDGTLRNGVFKLLQSAKQRRDRNMYLLAADPGITAKLRQEAAEAPASPLSITQRMLQSIKPRKIPDHVMQRIQGVSPEIRLVRNLVMLAAEIESPVVNPVLLLGETGTGKGLIARQIHEARHRGSDKPFVTVNCAAIPSELLEAELFGAEKGAGTGVEFRYGKWEAAKNGTLFLDEIGDLRSDHQAKILHALQDRNFCRVGSNTPIPARAGVITATNCNLLAMIEENTFREDLYFRLNKFMIRTYPVREIRDDVEIFIHRFWTGKFRLSEAVLEELKGYRWPGNVRELKTVLQGLATYFGGGEVTVEQLKDYWEFLGHSGSPGAASKRMLSQGMSSIDILRHLHRTGEAVNACRETLSKALENKRDIPDASVVRSSLSFQLTEIGTLCSSPEFFGDSDLYWRMQRIQAGVYKLGEALGAGDQDAAGRIWIESLAGDCEAADVMVRKQLSSTLGRI